MKTQGSVDIDRPIDEVFRLTNEHVPQWSLVVVDEQTIEKQPGEVGSTFRSITEENGRRMEFNGVVTRYEPPRASAVQLTGPMFDIDVQYDFTDLGGSRTRVTQTSDVTGKGFLRVFFLLCGWMMRKSSCLALDKELASLKRFCEEQPPSESPR